jgi:thioredoxin reductase
LTFFDEQSRVNIDRFRWIHSRHQEAAVTLIDLTAPIVRDRSVDALPVAVIGSGPIGLSAAANLVEREIPFEVFEAGDVVADSVRRWGHTRLFSPWRHLLDSAAARMLEASAWSRPDGDALPTGSQLVSDYLAPLAALPQLAPHVRTSVEVIAVSRDRFDRTRTAGRSAALFLLRLRHRDGTVTETRASAVIDASGTYRTPNSLASSGLDPLGAAEVRDLITHALPDVLGADRERFAGRHAIVVGAGHSAANTLLKLADLATEAPGTRVTWVIRNAGAVRVTTSDDDELPARASIGRRVDRLVAEDLITLVDRFETIRLRRDGAGATLVGDRAGALEALTGDVIVNATGFRPDLGMLREIRLDLDDIVEAPRRLAPLIDPNVHTCGTVEPHGFVELTHPEENFYLAGMKSYGRAPTFLLATGYEQVRSITAHLAGDDRAASRVELVLPATGVCSTSLPGAGGTNGGSCCS